ncbi:MAG: translation factor SUA5, partial [Oscillospiraceae bacterium]|nr:translation factor SUA5 [Oscillospiraceae bacterium]
LRRLDEIGAERVYIRCPERDGVGLAVYNRLLRAAGFEVIDASDR